MVQVMLSYRNGICKHIPCAVKDFNASSYRSQHPHGRMPEKLLQILAPSKNQIIDQIYTQNLFGVSCLHHSSGNNKLTPDTKTATQGTGDGLQVRFVQTLKWTSVFPAFMQNVEAAWAARNKTFLCPLEEMSLMVRPQCQAFLAPCVSCWHIMAGPRTEGWRGPLSRRAAEFKVSCPG